MSCTCSRAADRRNDVTTRTVLQPPGGSLIFAPFTRPIFIIKMLEFGFIDAFIAPIRFSYFTTLNVIYLRRSVREVVALKCYSKWSANESDFCPFLSKHRRSEK